MPKILALDTSNGACSAAVWADDRLGPARFELMTRGHAERLMPMIDAVMAEAASTPETLDLIAVTTGPGAFTGLRLGLAAARGLALAIGVPCLGATSTETLAAAAAAAPGELTVALIDTKRGGFYLQVFGADGCSLAPPGVAGTADLAACVGAATGGPQAGQCVLVGDAQPAGAVALTRAGWSARATAVVVPDARQLAALAAARWRPGDTVAMPRPLYLRPPDAAVPKDGGRIRS